jgi:hypothetical protein
MGTARSPNDVNEQVGTAVPSDSAAEQLPAWEQIAKGRYMPRRIRGSCLGRELG